MRMDLLHRHCADLGVDVEWADLGSCRRGEYRHRERLIVLNRRLTVVQATCTLSHEVGHAVLEDTETTPAVERRASEFGAGLIITPWEYERAEQIRGCCPQAMADELEVTVHLVEAWRRHYRVRGHAA